MLIEEWQGKEISFPEGLVVINQDSTSLGIALDADYKIVTYIDSTGCVSCKLNLYMWNLLKKDMEALAHKDVSLFFYFCSKDIEKLRFLMKRDNFNFPAYIDNMGKFYQLNKIHPNEAFHTFLLDKDNKVLAVGNPVLNPAVKDLYLRIIRGDVPTASNRAATPMTTISFDTTLVDLGHFPWQEPQSFTFTLKNTGDRPLVIRDVVSSCGCVEVEYPEEPVRAGHERELRVRYRAKSRGPVSQSMLVYSNAEKSPGARRNNHRIRPVALCSAC